MCIQFSILFSFYLKAAIKTCEERSEQIAQTIHDLDAVDEDLRNTKVNVDTERGEIEVIT